MRSVLHIALGIVVAVAQLSAADREQFTLKDGRVLVGTYDEISQTLNIENPKASMHVDARDIVKRDEAPPPVETAPKTKTDPAPAAEAKPTPGGMPAYAVDLLKLVEAQRAADAEAKKYQDAAFAAGRRVEMAWESSAETFLESADLSPITINVPQNPTQADLSVAAQKRQFNETLGRLSEEKKDPKRKNVRGHLVGAVPNARDFFSQFGEWKGPAWVGDVLGRRNP